MGTFYCKLTLNYSLEINFLIMGCVDQVSFTGYMLGISQIQQWLCSNYKYGGQHIIVSYVTSVIKVAYITELTRLARLLLPIHTST